MNTQKFPARRRATHSRLRMRGLVGFVLALLLLLPFAGPVHARLDQPVRNDPVGITDRTDIVITALGDGRAVNGALPPVGATWPITSYPTSVPQGYTTENVDFAGIINTQDAQGTTSAQMYCIDLRTSTRVGIGYENGTWTEANVPNIGYVERILNTYYPSSNLPAAQDNNRRAAAVQAAIWFFTDGYVVRRTDPIYPLVAQVVNETIAAGPQAEPPAPDISITPATAEASVNGVAGPYTVTAQEGADITVSTADGFTLYADAAGTVPLTNPVASGTQVWVRSDAGNTGPADILAQAAVTVPTGNVYLYDNATPGTTQAQKLILAATRTLTSNANASASFFEVGSLAVTKTIAGEAAGSQGAVVINIDCGPGYQFTFNIDEGTTEPTSQTFNEIPVGSTCTITEPTNGETETVAVTTVPPDPVAITAGTTATATVANTYTFLPGTLAVTKTIAGEAAGAQDEVVITVVCTSGETEVVNDTINIPANATEVTPTEYGDLPAGTSCVVTETSSGETPNIAVETIGTGTFTVPAAGSVEAAVTNTYTFRTGVLAVRKLIEGAAAGQQGEVTLSVVCTGGSTLSTTITIPAGATETDPEEYPGLIAGTSCVVTETANGSSTEIGVETVFDPAGATVIIPVEGGVEVTVTNTYSENPGSLTVSKVIAGAFAGQQGEVQVDILCRLDDETTFSTSITIAAGTTDPTTETFGDIPAGSECAVTESLTGETDQIAVEVDLPDSVVIAPGGTGTATVTNTYTEKPGIITVYKNFEGPAAGSQEAVEIQVTCTLDGATVFEETFQGPAQVTSPVFGRYLNVPAGAACAVTELEDGSTPAILVETDLSDPFTVPAGGEVEATVINTYTFAPGAISVSKVIDGEAAGNQEEVQLRTVCILDGETVLDESFTIPEQSTGTESTEYAELPVGAECTVTETQNGATDTIGVSTVEPDPVTIEAGSGVAVEVTNTYFYNPGTLEVTKQIAGAAAGQQGEVVLNVICTVDGETVLDETVTVPAGATGEVTSTYGNLVPGSECAVTETATGVTTGLEVSTTVPDPVTIAAAAGSELRVVNTYTATSKPAPAKKRLPSTGAEFTGGFLAMGAGLIALGGLGVAAANRRRGRN
ncbi:DUF5979 domain-containing protein [Arthrobacter caoxuetaonis]|uniref:DUF5979 domain-containing protein n=1 Tax=Arthrobacter caoxuetaonis TaxID=2886935 RepID=A0A9X1MF04_9MICC|nr:DUF5979 domain-containing protein [Arthrobacter caoxuetaonis]MCC3297990.1 DUF5979 domain-containing protein [Arthrobacter caoxuetaonis]USQ57004.1 DUF5979 domain-containing protein [Arthrobacter caoxuetaonis]